jgi:hypothetical protein
MIDNVLPFYDKEKEEWIAAVLAAISRPPDFQAGVFLLAIDDHAAGGRLDTANSNVDPKLAETLKRISTMRWLLEAFCHEKGFDLDELIKIAEARTEGGL